MNLIITSLLLLICLLLSGLLLPRIRFIIEYEPDRRSLSVRNPWFRYKLDLLDYSYLFRILFFKFRGKDSPRREDGERSGISPQQAPHRSPKSIPVDQSKPDAEEKPQAASGNFKTPPKPDKSRKRKNSRKRKRFRLINLFRKFAGQEKKPAESGTRGYMRGYIWDEKELIAVIFRRILRRIIRIMNTPRLDYMRADLLIATSDPALTGILHGIAWQARALHKPPRRTISIRSDFDSDMPDLKFALSISIAPLKLLFEGCFIVILLPWYRIYKAYRRFRVIKLASEKVIK